jgi:lysozyme family protein
VGVLRACYVLNRPLNYIDPTGHAQISPDDGGVGCLAKITCKTDDVWRAYEVSGGNDQEKKAERASKRLEQAYWDHQEGDAASAKDTAVVADAVSASVNFAAQNSAGGVGARREINALTTASKVETQGVIAGNGSVTRKVNF